MIPEAHKKGNSFAHGSPQDFDGFAVFKQGLILDTEQEWIDDPNKIILILDGSGDCETFSITIGDLNFSTGDTTFLFPVEDSNILPRVNLFKSHYDALLGSYDLLESEESWILIDEVNLDTTAIHGQFNLTFFDPDASEGEQKTMSYSNGEFDAEFGAF